MNTLASQEEMSQTCEINSYDHYVGLISKIPKTSLSDTLQTQLSKKILCTSVTDPHSEPWSMPKIHPWIHLEPYYNFKINTDRTQLLACIILILNTNNIKYTFNINENNYILNPIWITGENTTQYNDIYFKCTVYIKTKCINFFIRPFLQSQDSNEYIIEFQSNSKHSLEFPNMYYDFRTILQQKCLQIRSLDSIIQDDTHSFMLSCLLNKESKISSNVFSFEDFRLPISQQDNSIIDYPQDKYSFTKAFLLSQYKEDSMMGLNTICNDIIELDTKYNSEVASKLVNLLHDVVHKIIEFLHNPYDNSCRLALVVLTFLIEQKRQDSEFYDSIYNEICSHKTCNLLSMYLKTEDIFMHNLIIRLTQNVSKKFSNKCHSSDFISLYFNLQERFPMFTFKESYSLEQTVKN